jgi:amino acid permease
VIVGIGISVDDIEVVFNFIGAICSTTIAILLPCFFYFMLIIKKNKPRNIKFYISITFFVIMVPFAIFSVVAQYTKE